jgi:hypothetical protein
MFSLPVISFSRNIRSGPPQVFSEFVASFGLVSVIWGCSRLRSNAVAFAVGAYIMAAYWFTASTSFANPAVTIARCLSDTFAGIRPTDVPWFVIAQFLGSIAATLVFRGLCLICRFEPEKFSSLMTPSRLAPSTLVLHFLLEAERFVNHCTHVRCLRVRPGKVKLSGAEVFVTQPPSQVMKQAGLCLASFADNWPCCLRMAGAGYFFFPWLVVSLLPLFLPASFCVWKDGARSGDDFAR